MKTMMNNTRNETNQTIEPLKDRNNPKDNSFDTIKDKQKSGNENENHEKIKNYYSEKNDSATLNLTLQKNAAKNEYKTKLPQRKFTKLEDYKQCLEKQTKIEKKTDEIKESIERGKVSKLVSKFEMIGKYNMPRENLLACTNNSRKEEETNTLTISLSNTVKEKEIIQPQENNVINFSDELKIDVKEKINKINEKSSLNKKIVKEKKKNEGKSLVKTIKNETKEIIHEEKNNLKKENISFAAKIRNIFSVKDNENRSKLLEKMCMDRVEKGSYFDLTKYNCEAEEFIPKKEEESINYNPGIFYKIISFFTCGKKL